jgi:hypothetical protein
MTLIFDLIVFLIIGLIAGAIASFYMGRQQELVHCRGYDWRLHRQAAWAHRL